MTMAVVLVAVAFIALYGSRVIFAPGSQPVSGDVPTADVLGGYRHAQQSMGFAVTVPAGIPSSWHPNSFTTSNPTVDGAGTLPTVRGGWVTPDGAFITLIESSGDETQLLQAEIGTVGQTDAKTRAGGASWTVTNGKRSELAWIRHSGGTTFLITGNAPEQDFVTVAESVAAG